MFTLDNGDPIEPTRMLRRFQKWQTQNKSLNLPSVDVHSLRHTGATYTYHVTQNDIRSVQLRAGHTKPQMSHEYVDYDEEDKIAIVDCLEQFYEKSPIEVDDVENVMSVIKSNLSILKEVLNLIAKQ